MNKKLVLVLFFLVLAAVAGCGGGGGSSNTATSTTDATNPSASADPYWTNGSGTSSSPYLIQSAADLLHLAQSVNSGVNYSGVYFQMTTDIDLQGQQWTPIGNTSTHYFSGTFDGNKHTVKNLYMNAVMKSVGLFGLINNATVKNLSIAGSSTVSCDTTNTCFIAAVAGAASQSTITNCHNEETITCSVEGPNNLPDCYIGGIVGSADASTIQNCYNTGTVSGKAASTTSSSTTGAGSFCYAGGVVGYMTSTTKIINCYNNGSITGTAPRDYSISYTGGVVGFANSNSSLSKCYNIGTISGNGYDVDCYAGGIIGKASDISLTDCYNTGSIIGRYYNTDNTSSNGITCYVGGVSGYITTSTLNSCCNRGSVTAKNVKHGCDVGGITGTAWSSVTFSNCYNTGTLNCETTSSSACTVIGNAGGLIGRIATTTSCSIVFTNCYNTGAINCTAPRCDAGGIIGFDHAASFTNCYNAGTVTCSGTNYYRGGIIGYDSATNPNIISCYYLSGCVVNANSFGTAKSSSYLQSSDFVTALNTNNMAWQTGNAANNGYPILTASNFIY